jgi:hypothetical protein
VWLEQSDAEFSRAAIPFALKERNRDCLHNGLLTFLFNDRGDVSKVAFQIVAQTCQYFQFELSGVLSGEYVPEPVAKRDALVSAFRTEVRERLPIRAIAELPAHYPGTDPGEFGSTDEIPSATMSVYGFVIDRTHYVGGCDTPYGEYPYCDEWTLPSFSTAKSLAGGLALMIAEKLYPGTAASLVTDYVPECSSGWQGVTIEHALDMTTGHYGSAEPHADESSAAFNRFLDADDHSTKIDFACKAYPRRSAPGEVWVYQTWATYLAGTAINARLKSVVSENADFYDDLIVEKLWNPLQLSQLADRTRRTYDSVAQPFTGYGLSFVRDDIAKIAVFLGPSDGRVNGVDMLERRLFDAIKQRVSTDPGMPAESSRIRYNNGFRTFDVTHELGCRQPTYVTTMSGYGGINIILMPNDTAYYYFSDGGIHRYLHAVRESHKVRPMCSS